jgi:hypothetical protein
LKIFIFFFFKKKGIYKELDVVGTNPPNACLVSSSFAISSLDTFPVRFNFSEISFLKKFNYYYIIFIPPIFHHKHHQFFLELLSSPLYLVSLGLQDMFESWIIYQIKEEIPFLSSLEFLIWEYSRFHSCIDLEFHEIFLNSIVQTILPIDLV